MTNYAQFLERKSQIGGNHGFEPDDLPPFLFDFQTDLVRWALLKGRAAIFADCGLGKSPMELVWADEVCRKTGGNVLLVTFLAVTAQMEREAAKFGITAARSKDGTAHRGITITNYESLNHFSPSDFVGAVCDESSILKSFSGVRKQEITAFMRKMKYRLLATATAAPNDYIELGTSSEALGYLGYMDMLNKFFKNDLNNSSTGRYRGQTAKFRLKGHAELPFWRWVCSWARAIRTPSDLGFDDTRFILPDLIERQHVVKTHKPADGMLFALPATDLASEREELKRTLKERCEKVAELVSHDQPALAWCHGNEEGDMLEKLIPDAIQVSGKDSDDAKERKLMEFADGHARVLVTKPKIGAWGLNFQHCNHITFFPSHSFEQYYQSIRRCWRFGQERPVHVDLVTTEGQDRVLKNMQRKQRQANQMFANLVEHMRQGMGLQIDQGNIARAEVPSWL
jgi:hypothetical protein